MTSEGEGLGVVPKIKYIDFKSGENGEFSVVKIPKTVPGDIVTARLLMHQHNHVEGLLVKVQNEGSRNSIRNNRYIVCNKFNECTGCNFQMLSYDDQLNLKQKTIQKAFRYFYPKIFDSIPMNNFGVVSPSPVEYSYRTKLTPHFTYKRKIEDVAIGYNHIDPTKGTIDIDHCPIATRSINQELVKLRSSTLEGMASRQPKHSQSTLVLRESIRINFKTGDHNTVCLTDPNKVVTEKVGDFVFQFPVNEFFQNNNSILPLVLEYIKYHFEGLEFKNLIDTYCGSGFFGISLSKEVPDDGKVYGVELAKKSIEYATHNAKINGLKVPEKVYFIHGSADEIFTNKVLKKANIIGSDSVVIMDPSRKGSNKDFLEQLFAFRPKLIVYISCNVFTQARDLSQFMELQGETPAYRIKDVTGFDFFPQTKHVESVAILELL
ncbi:RNA methyltransferase [Yamadazyma tenuis]|nr:RNA methyltransferase [Yamadazyma tenuis]